jgi:hypothetical protein
MGIFSTHAIEDSVIRLVIIEPPAVVLGTEV